jgi:hypothetical protein
MAGPVRQSARRRPIESRTARDAAIPAGWSVSVKGPATIITPPEGGSHIVYVDVEAEDAESALAPAVSWPGWSRRRRNLERVALQYFQVFRLYVLEIDEHVLRCRSTFRHPIPQRPTPMQHTKPGDGPYSAYRAVGHTTVRPCLPPLRQ